jgi:putative SOS response-associated peptidase YedK
MLHSCAIVTCPPNDAIRPIHDRMPVVLDPAVESAWLDPSLGEEELLELLRPLDSSLIAIREVSDAVNDVRNDNAELIAPREVTESLF